MRTAFFRTLTDAALEDSRIMLITADLGFGAVSEFAERLPRQFINAGVAEQNMTAIACGLALEHRKVFTYSIANFSTLRCLEHIRNDVCYHDADVTVVAMGGGFSYGQLGMSHFATEDLAILRALPHMKVLAPTSVAETSHVTRALLARRGPAYLRLDKDAVTAIPNAPFEFGRASQLRPGMQLTIMAVGGIAKEAVAAADVLARSGISTRVLAFHSLKPLDTDSISKAVRETGAVITLEEHTVTGGLGSAIAETVLDAGLPLRFFARMGLNDEFPTIVGDQAHLRRVHSLDASAVVAKALEALSQGSASMTNRSGVE